jgi:hypothetical protein
MWQHVLTSVKTKSCCQMLFKRLHKTISSGTECCRERSRIKQKYQSKTRWIYRINLWTIGEKQNIGKLSSK